MANTLNLGTDGNWATKQGSLLGYNSENNNYKPLPFTFDRASSATRVNKDGLIETVGADQPRVDYLNDSNGALLLEPSRTNLVQYSEDFSNSYWTKGTNGSGSVTINQNAITSPDGALNADEIVIVGGAGNLQFLYRNITGLTITNGNKYNAYVYVKGQGTIDLIFRFGGGAQGSTVQRLTLSNTWVKHNITLTATGSASNAEVFFQSQTGATSINFYAWGFQVEEGSYATSYIPTSGSAVTRLADVCTNGGNEQVINSTEGTIYAEQKSLETNFSYNYFVSVSDGTSNNRLEIRQSGTGLQFLWRVGGTYQSQIVKTNAPFTSVIKFALRYSSTDIKFYVNGSLVGTINSPTLYATGTLNNIQFADGSGGSNFRGIVKECRYYNTALTDQELQNLTS